MPASSGKKSAPPNIKRPQPQNIEYSHVAYCSILGIFDIMWVGGLILGGMVYWRTTSNFNPRLAAPLQGSTG